MTVTPHSSAGAGLRKADRAHGDDGTLSRFVKVDPKARHKPRQARLPGFEAAFVQEGRTKFPKSVHKVAHSPNILVSGHNNAKIGRDVRKGHLHGYWIYALSLEERKTCPSSCSHWQSCYGNNMPYANRIDHTDPEFLPGLEAQLDKLCKQREGILVRLHALGDFYSSEYVAFWGSMLQKHENLAIYGYTARESGTGLGWTINELNKAWGKRCMIRFSNARMGRMATVTIGNEESCPTNAFICPEQTGKTRACATCAACWSTDKNVAFLEH